LAGSLDATAPDAVIRAQDWGVKILAEQHVTEPVDDAGNPFRVTCPVETEP
jgi:hypothetical protein